MEFSVPCEVFSRLSSAALGHNEFIDPLRPALRSVRIEYLNGRKYAVASNSRILVCEFLGETIYENGSINIANHPTLVEQCDKESAWAGELRVTLAGGWGAAQTTFGYFHPENVNVADEWPDWRKFVPEELPTKPYGSVIFDNDSIARLALASPSGGLVLPKFIDTREPILVRADDDANWFGLFLLNKAYRNVEPATYPTWFRHG